MNSAIVGYGTLSGVIVHCRHCLRPFTGAFSSYRIAKSHKMTFWRQEKSRKVTLVGQSHLRNPQVAENGFMLL
jgi:hypothetical protein